MRFPRILNLFIVLNLAYLQKENTFNVGFFSYPNLKWRISIRGSERKLIYRLRTSEWEEIRFESGKMKLILESIFLIGSVMSETCSYLDSSAENCSAIETLIPRSCESDAATHLTLDPSESEEIQRQGCTSFVFFESCSHFYVWLLWSLLPFKTMAGIQST